MGDSGLVWHHGMAPRAPYGNRFLPPAAARPAPSRDDTVQARGAVEGRLLQARAGAEATRVRGEAEGDAIRAQARALQEARPSYVALEQTRRWNGQLPARMLSGAPLPVLNPPGGVQGR